MKKKSLFKYLQNTFLILAFYFIVRFIWLNKNELLLIKIQFNWLYLFISFLSSCFIVLVMTSNTQLIYSLEKIKLKFWQTFKVNVLANLYRYVPGGIWSHIGIAVQLAKNTNTSLKKNTKLRVLQVFFNIYFGLFVLVFILPPVYNWLFLGVYFLLVLSTNSFLQLLNRFWPVIFKKQEMHFPSMTLVNLFKQVGISLLFWFSIAFSYTFFLKGLGVNNLDAFFDWLYVGSAYVLAYIVGFLVLPAPSGFGVREFVMATLLSKVNIVLSIGVSITLLFRLLLLIRDLLLYFFSFFIKTD